MLGSVRIPAACVASAVCALPPDATRMVKKLERLETAWLKGFFTDIRYNFGILGEREFRCFSV